MSPRKDQLPTEILRMRSPYIQELQKIEPHDGLEASDIQDTIQWLRAEPNIYKPHNMKRHLGVIFLVLSPDWEQTFMINHKKAQTWLPPGGHVDTGLSFRDAVRLEMREELQRDAVFIHPDPFFLTNTRTRGLNAGHIDTTAWFLLKGNPSESYSVMEKEASDARWMTTKSLQQMPEFTHLPRAYAKLLTRRGR